MKKVKLTQVCTPKQWATISTDKLLDNGYPVYGANGQIGYYNKYNHENPTLMITCRGATCGTINISQPKSYINGNAMCLDNLDNRINLRYMYYQLLNYDFSDVISGSAQPQITREGLEKVWLNFHENEEEQKEFADRLDKVSSLIEKRKTQLAKLDELIKSRFIEMFGDLERNSKNWGIKSFSEFAVIDTNMTNDFVTYADYPHIGIDSIEKNTGVLSGYRTIKEDNVISGKYLFTPEHIIYSKIRPNLNKVALPDFYGLCSADAYPILARENCNRIFLAVLMRSDFFLKHVLSLCGRANQPKVNKEQVQAFRSPFPPIELQNEFAEFVKLIDKSKLVIQKSIDKLETLKKSLMQQYFG